MPNELQVIENHFKPLMPRMEKAIPAAANLPVKRVMESVLIALEGNSKLMDCSAQSMQKAVFTACTLGLLVDGPSGQGYLVPYKGECQFQTGVKGYGTIAARSGFILNGGVVYEGERYQIVLGSGGSVKVEPDFSIRGSDKAKIVAAWATLESNKFPTVVDAMSLDEIMRIRSFSKATYADSPWNKHFDQMAIKTIKKRLCKSCPIDILQLAGSLDDAVDQGKTAYIRAEDQALIIDQEAQSVSRTQAPPSEPFTVDRTVKFEVIFGDGVVRDLGTLENWQQQIWNRLQKVDDPAALRAFLERNQDVFDKIAERHATDVEGLRIKVRDRIQELSRPSSRVIDQEPSTAAPARQEQPSAKEAAPAKLELFDAPNVSRKFDDLVKYLTAYEITVSFMYKNNKGSELLKFDGLNKAPIEAMGIGDAIAKINARVRVPATQGGLGV